MAYPTVFAGLSSATGAQLDGNFNAAGLLGTIPCAVSGSNALTMTPYTAGANSSGTPPFGLQPQVRVSGIVASSNTTAATANVAGTGAFPIYKDTSTGPAALSGGEMVASNLIVLTYDPALNSGNGGWHLISNTTSAAGSVTSVATGTGLTGGPITTAGTISLASIADKRLLANISGSSAAPLANTLTGILDSIMSSTAGAILARGGSVWAANTETSWSPTIAFGGSSTGMTFATQVGQYYAIGNLVIAMFNIVLTAKGSATGSATINLPVAAGGSNRTGSVIISNYSNLTSVTTVPFGSIAASATTGSLYVAGSATVSALNDTNFSNNTSISGMLMYFSG